jgi:hypothetical protein
MAHISGFERNQLLLPPEAVDDYVGSDNPLRFIDAFVDGLDLVEQASGGFSRRRRDGRAMHRRPVKALNLRLSQSRAFEQAVGGRMPVANAEAGLQDRRRFPRRQSRRLQIGVSSIHAAVQAARPVRTRTPGGGRDPHQGGQQQGSRCRPQFAGEIHQGGRRAVRG